MPEVNTEKIFASFLLSVEQVTSIDEFNDLEKEYLGKNSLISEERKKLSSMSEISRKKYGKVLQELSTQISERLNQERLSFQSKFFKERKKYWLLPIFLALIAFGALIILSQGSAVAPLIYTLF